MKLHKNFMSACKHFESATFIDFAEMFEVKTSEQNLV